MKSSKLQKYNVFYNNSEEYHHLKREIFSSNLYYFETNNPTPVIIDVGAHIGLSTLYFKQIYPNAKIIAIEPNPEMFKLLEKNIFENQLDDVTVINAALSDRTGQELLFMDSTNEQWHSTASFHKGSWAGTQYSEDITVQTHTLSEFITQPIDFLKIDIEGAEQKVLLSSIDSLNLVKEMMFEFHTHPTQNLKKLLEPLDHIFKTNLYKGTKEILLKKATGLITVTAVNRRNK